MPQAAGGATAMMPKNGLSGISAPHDIVPIIRFAVERDVDQRAPR